MFLSLFYLSVSISYNRIQVFHSLQHILLYVIQLQTGFLISLIVVDKFQQADITLLETCIHPFDDTIEIPFQLIV